MDSQKQLEEAEELESEELVPSLLNSLPPQLIEKAARIIEKAIDNDSKNKEAQIEFQKLQIDVRKQEIELQKISYQNNQEINSKNIELSKEQSKLNHKLNIYNLIFKAFIYCVTVFIVYNLSLEGKMNEVLWTIFGIVSFSVFGIDIKNFISNVNTKESNN